MAATRIARWGNSLGLRLPKDVARDAHLDVGDAVDVAVSHGTVVISPARPRYALNDLVDGITPRNRHRASEWGPPVGHEQW